MTIYNPNRCLITNLEAIPKLNDKRLGWTYYITTKDNKKTLIHIEKEFEQWKDEQFFIENKHIIAGAIINNEFAQTKGIKNTVVIGYKSLHKKINELVYPRTPKEKLDNLFTTLVNKQRYDGDFVRIYDKMLESSMYYGHYFKTVFECFYYADVLHNMGLINGVYDNSMGVQKLGIEAYRISFEGLNYYINLTEEGTLSNNCFIAMSFSENVKEIRKAIKSALLKTKYTPILIDEQHLENTQTINDGIIAALNKSKFCIADFTEQKDGVYFESGYALGQNKKVIYTCSKKWFKKSHFDTNHFPHIIYNSPEDLEEKLIDKIDAWIK